MDGMALIGDNIPSLGNQELLVRLIFGIGMAFFRELQFTEKGCFQLHEKVLANNNK